MSNNIIQRYMWFFDTVWRYKRITRAEIEFRWLHSDISNGEPLSRRSFCNYREGAEKLFDVNILCDSSTFEYYIEETLPEKSSDLQRWLFDSLSVNYMMRHNTDIAHRILPEHIAIIMDGNGRWAKKRALPRTAGHAAGSKKFKEIALRILYNLLGDTYNYIALPIDVWTSKSVEYKQQYQIGIKYPTLKPLEVEGLEIKSEQEYQTNTDRVINKTLKLFGEGNVDIE